MYLDEIVAAQKRGEARGITSVCSAHPLVLEAALRHGKANHIPVLIESTCNQVNQFGGYTGMTPQTFITFVRAVADQVGFEHKNLLLGGDHLGPLAWAHEPAATAMQKAETLVRAYVRAGFTKIHLDCSMPCADDYAFSVDLMAQRAAQLAQAAEAVALEQNTHVQYVIGTEVPQAGGAKVGETHISVTDPADARQTITLTRNAFFALGLEQAWTRVIALVVQPGVEFGSETIHSYDRVAAAGLARYIESIPGLIYEAHSTDYQTRSVLRALVEDHFSILKVGPRLTFAMREAIFALGDIETVICPAPSRVREALEQVMLQNPVHWQKHYSGDAQTQKLARLYSFSDRIRYYWNTAEVQQAIRRQMANLGETPLPLALLSQYLPAQYQKIRTGTLSNRPHELIVDHVKDVLEDYAFACSKDIKQ